MERNCKGSWLDNYIEYTKNQESPTAFHHWVGLTILGAALGRHIWIPRIKYTIYPNLFVILVAGSAQCRKSVSVGMGMDLLRCIESPPMIFAQKITTEALIQALEQTQSSGYSAGLVCASELSVFMGADGIRSGIIPTLTDLYDSPKEWTYHTRGRGKEVLKNVTLSILAASTKDWLRSSIPADAIGGGFTSRIIFICQDTPSKLVLFPPDIIDMEEAVLRAKLIDDLTHIRNKVSGEVCFSKEAKEVATEWYAAEHIKIRDPKLDGYFGRKHDTMFKVATLLSVAESDSCIVSAHNIKKALHLLDTAEQGLGEIIASVIATQEGGNTEKILDLIRREGKIKHADLLRKCWRFASSMELSNMIKTLLDSHTIIETIDTNKNTRYYELGVK